MQAPAGRILNIQRYCIDDGPGIRTTVFLKGCPLHCMWCHNPEGWEERPTLLYDDAVCIRCGRCVQACTRNCHRVDREHMIARPDCIGCGACVRVCPVHALEAAGMEISVDTLLEAVLRDRVFYRRSGGGVTLSGGEPLMQPDFTAAFLRALHEAGLHTCMETSGFAAQAVLAKAAQDTDLFLFDFKQSDPALHRRQTGQPLEPILNNLDFLMKAGKDVVLRCPIIPGCNTVQAHYDAILCLADRYPGLKQIELEPYHPFGLSKWRRAGKTPAYDNPAYMPREDAEKIAAYIAGRTEIPVICR